MVQDWIIGWFEKKAKMNKESVEQSLNQGYLEAGFIDSMDFIELIGDVEEHFGIQFNDEDFADESILTISGLINRIESECEK